jgi:GTP pyrophosphokinase
LNPHLRYLKTSHARSRVRQWFKSQDFAINAAAGRSILDRELHRLGISGLPAERLTSRFGYRQLDELLAAIGHGDVSTGQLANAINELIPQPETVETRRRRPGRRSQTKTPGGVKIQGVGNLLISLGRCCHPVPNDPIVGYITRGRGVTIHRRDCGNILQLHGEDIERLIEVEWGVSGEDAYLVDITLQAYDRPGLLRDITALLANEKINLNSLTTGTDAQDRVARMNLTLEVSNIEQLSRALTLIEQLPNVIAVQRRV